MPLYVIVALSTIRRLAREVASSENGGMPTLPDVAQATVSEPPPVVQASDASLGHATIN
jgi:hypothetical protein